MVSIRRDLKRKRDKGGKDWWIGLVDFFRPVPGRRSVRLLKERGVVFFNPRGLRRVAFYLANLFMFCCLIGGVYLYTPLVLAWWNYKFNLSGTEPEVMVSERDSPVEIPETIVLPNVPDELFSVNIPKIKAKARVIPNVNAGNRGEYLEALKGGVAHMAGSSYPGRGETIYLFAHSTILGLGQVRQNAVFYFLGELEVGDLVQLVHNYRRYDYRVYGKGVVAATETDYLGYKSEKGEVLILQTCWPIGTSWKRLLVFAEPV